MPANLDAIASEWGCSPRTAARWKHDGAPLDDSARLRAWLASRKNLPVATRAKLAELGRARRAQFVPAESDSDGPKVGAAAALRRLEQSEATAFTLLQSAIREGDPVEIKLARENWLRIGDSLRRYDLLVESNRRDSGELVQRKEIEAHVSAFVHWFKLACRRTISAIAPNLVAVQSVPEMADTLERAMFDDVLTALAVLAACPCRNKVPDWFLAAATKPMGDALNGADEAVKARVTALEEAFAEAGEAQARSEPATH